MAGFGEKKNGWKIVSLILIILIVCALVYFGVTKYKVARNAAKTETFNLGAQQGYVYAVAQIMQQASTCLPFSVYSNNITINLVEISCLKNYTLK